MSAYQTYQASSPVFAAAPAIYAAAPTTIASAPTVVVAPAVTYAGYTGASTTSWSPNNTMNLGDETIAKPLLNRVPQVKEASSVRSAVDLLNSGAVNMPGGICIVYSANQKQYFALYRSDRLKEFTEIFGSSQATSVGASVVTASGSQAKAYGTGITAFAAPAFTTIAAPAITSFAAPAVTTIAAPAVTSFVPPAFIAPAMTEVFAAPVVTEEVVFAPLITAPVSNTLGGAAYGGQVLETIGAPVAGYGGAYAGQVVETLGYGGAYGGQVVETIGAPVAGYGGAYGGQVVETLGYGGAYGGQVVETLGYGGQAAYGSMIAYPGLDGPFTFSAEMPATAPAPEAKAAVPTPEAKAAGKAKKESKKKKKACC